MEALEACSRCNNREMIFSLAIHLSLPLIMEAVPGFKASTVTSNSEKVTTAWVRTTTN